MEIKGKVHEILPTTQVSDKLSKRELILEYAEHKDHPEYLKIEAIQDKCAMLDNFRPGDNVEVHFNLRGRPWVNKQGVTTYFTSLALWKINKV